MGIITSKTVELFIITVSGYMSGGGALGTAYSSVARDGSESVLLAAITEGRRKDVGEVARKHCEKKHV